MKVSVHYLFSTRNKIGSKLISWGTQHIHPELQSPSHVAILVNNRWVIESTLSSGVRVLTYSKWKKIYNEIYKIPARSRDYDDIKAEYRKIELKSYDYLGVLYCGIFVGLNKLFGIRIPRKNLLEQKDAYFCCEAVAELMHITDYSMKTPIDIVAVLK